MAAERILIVENNTESRKHLAELFSAQGYAVQTAADGATALERIHSTPPDLMLLAMPLPEMDGLDLLHALNEQGLLPPFIFMAAHGSEALAEQVTCLGARAYLRKPYQPDTLLALVERILAETRLRAERDRLARELERARQTLQWQLQELNALFTVGKSVTATPDLEQALLRVVEAAVYLSRAEEGSLMLLDAKTGELYLRAAKNIDQTTAQGMRVSVTDSLAGRVIRTGRPVMLTGAGLKKVSTAYLAKSLLMVPLRTPERGVTGLLMVVNRQSERPFDESDLHLLSAMADYAAVAIENAALLTNLQTEKRKLETILRETRDAVLVIDPQGDILLCNPAACQALELGDRWAGQPATEAIRNADLLDLLDHLQRPDVPLQTEVTLADGRILNAHASPIEGVGTVIVMQDITYLKELERVKSEFIATVSHDLRTPLTAIQGYIDLLPRVGPLTEQQREFITRLQRSLSSVTQLVTDLLEIGRVEVGFDLEMSQVDLGALINEAVAELRPEADAKRQHLQVNVPVDLEPITGNPRRLRQVIVNLVSNAVKYTPENGHITVSVAESQEHVSISVTDDGIGIPLADQPFIFDKFFRVDSPETRDIPGTGLGLSIVKSIVEKHRGRVWVESTPGQGSTFTVLLPK